MDDLSQFCCQNKNCPDHGKRNAGNLTVCQRHGKDKQFRTLYCRTCKARFSERKGTALFGARLPEKKIFDLLRHVQEGCGVRKTSRLVGVDDDTVTRYCRLEGLCSNLRHDTLVAFSP